MIALPKVFQGNMVAAGNWPSDQEEAAAVPAFRAPDPVAVAQRPALDAGSAARHWSPEQG